MLILLKTKEGQAIQTKTIRLYPIQEKNEKSELLARAYTKYYEQIFDYMIKKKLSVNVALIIVQNIFQMLVEDPTHVTEANIKSKVKMATRICFLKHAW